MTRHLTLLALVATLALTGCDKVKALTKRNKLPATPSPTAAAPASAEEPSLEASAPAAATSPEEADATPAKAAVNPHASVMVLCLHNIEDKSAMKALTITTAELERELSAIKEHGFSVIGMQDFLAWRRGEKEIPGKSCVITIDDGWVSGYTNAWPLLKKYGYPFTLFVYVNYIGSGGKSLSWDQLAEMRDAGVDIQCHTYSHSNLRAPGTGVDARTKALVQKDIQALGKEGWLRKEVIESKKVLEERLGIKVNALAYPFGIHTNEARALVKEAGYEAAFTVYGQRLTHSSPFDLLGRYAVEAAKPVIFDNALAMVGGGVTADDANSSASMQGAATSMVTQPMEGETISDPKPTVKANLATLGDIDPKSVEMRVSGFGLVPAHFDPATKTISFTPAQGLKPGTFTVIIGAKSNGRPVGARWSFTYAPEGSAATGKTPGPASRAAEPTKKR